MGKNIKSAGTIFITGISASGKTTLGKRLKEGLLKSGIENLKLLDGEQIRKELAEQGKSCGYSTDERSKIALEIARMALEYNRKGIICIICSICHIREIRRQMRAIIGNIMEVYLDCAVDVCARRDHKGQYLKAFQGGYDNFIGVTEPYQKFENVELVLHTDADLVDECSRVLLKSAMDFLKYEK